MSELAEEWIAILDVLHREEFLNDPNGVWNLDEAAFSLGEMWSRVYACKGTNQVKSTTDYDEKEHLTMLGGRECS